MNMIGWKVWYADGSTYSSRTTEWKDLPYDEMQFVKIFYDEQWKPGYHYTKILDGKDWYYMSPDGSIEGNPSVGWDGWVSPPCSCSVAQEDLKRGTGMTTEEFERMTVIVKEDRTWR